MSYVWHVPTMQFPPIKNLTQKTYRYDNDLGSIIDICSYETLCNYKVPKSAHFWNYTNSFNYLIKKLDTKSFDSQVVVTLLQFYVTGTVGVTRTHIYVESPSVEAATVTVASALSKNFVIVDGPLLF